MTNGLGPARNIR